MSGFYAKVIKLLKQHGFRHVRTRKHETWMNDEGVAVTVTRNMEAKPTAERTLKDAGIDHRLL